MMTKHHDIKPVAQTTLERTVFDMRAAQKNDWIKDWIITLTNISLCLSQSYHLYLSPFYTVQKEYSGSVFI